MDNPESVGSRNTNSRIDYMSLPNLRFSKKIRGLETPQKF
jgi:hypothetical protein